MVTVGQLGRRLLYRVVGQKDLSRRDEELTFAYSIIGVDLEQPDRRAAFQRHADDSCPVQSEVVTPLLFAWSEEAAELARVRIEGGEISPLVPIAAPAREGQVPRFGCSAVLLGDHMVHLVRKECHGGWEEAVLAA